MARILLAEDDDSMRTFLHQALERAGHAVVAVPDGGAALEQVRNEEFDLLIADIVMPGLDGIELSRRATRIAPGMKVLFITGFAAVAMTARQEFMDAQVLSKPFHLRDLVAHVGRLLPLR